MNKVITLKTDGTARLDTHEPFILPTVDDLTLCFNNAGIDLEHAFIRLKNSGKTGVFAFRKIFTVPKDFCREGLLNILVYNIVGDEVINSWTVFPLKIKYSVPPKNTYGEKVIYDYVAALETRIAAIEEKLPKSIF